MKNRYLLLAFIALAQLATYAQPVAHATDVAVSNFSGEFFFATADNFNPGPSGANQTWDFSFLSLTAAGTNATVPLAGSPFATTFPNSNWVYKFSGWGGDMYYYHLLTPAKLEILSLALTGSSGENYINNPRTLAEFPMTFNSSYTDSYRSVGETTDTQVVATYDAYGTLVMPFKTYQNVIRQKVVTNGVTDYIWFNVSPFYPIVQTVLAENAIGVTTSNTVLSSEGSDLSDHYRVYPNPTSDFLTFSLDDATAGFSIVLTDLTGKRLMAADAKVGNHEVSLDLRNLPAGIYLARLSAPHSKTVATKKIIRK